MPWKTWSTETRASIKKGGHTGTRLKMIGDGSLGKTLNRDLRRIIAQDARKMTKLKEVRSLEWRIYRRGQPSVHRRLNKQRGFFFLTWPQVDQL